ncbi:hypothetical protein MHLP_02810 [Candidatus Mycoplasma haematolamae str. Purdue]|uniref:Uncharacterized protein n=1 Tax=Mycoplasma haematolamae (strain Purdue) TaxID=1212765 RepID=I7C6J4_MYCHA|nr:hypothetical protein [Candidatus Mycoplasma haematolamae]AFO52142.1 hypothetical protein MHLP_02810 [Candidatus Mycoplasma haematolamae str. Purdue]
MFGFVLKKAIFPVFVTAGIGSGVVAVVPGGKEKAKEWYSTAKGWASPYLSNAANKVQATASSVAAKVGETVKNVATNAVSTVASVAANAAAGAAQAAVQGAIQGAKDSLQQNGTPSLDQEKSKAQEQRPGEQGQYEEASRTESGTQSQAQGAVSPAAA